MKRLAMLVLLGACQPKASKESMQKEYDSLYQRITWQKDMIKSDSDLLAVDAIARSIEGPSMQRRIDSLKIDLRRLETRRQELAEQLFK